MENDVAACGRHNGERIAREIELLYRSALDFRSFLVDLTPDQRDWITAGLPWRDEPSDLWIDFEAWVLTTVRSLRDPVESQKAHEG